MFLSTNSLLTSCLLTLILVFLGPGCQKASHNGETKIVKQVSSKSAIGNTIKGTFVDDPVIGLTYSSGGITGLTDMQGQYECIVGEKVSFYLGNLLLGTTTCSPMIFPLHLAGATALNPNGGSVAMGVLLHALDTGENENYLTLPLLSNNYQFDFSVDFSQFDATQNLDVLSSILQEMERIDGADYGSNAILANYTSLASNVQEEMEKNLAIVDLPANIEQYVGKFFALQGILEVPLSGEGCADQYIDPFTQEKTVINFGFTVLAATNSQGSKYYIARLLDSRGSKIFTDLIVAEAVITSREIHIEKKVSDLFNLGVSGSTMVVLELGADPQALQVSAMVVDHLEGPTRNCYFSLSGGEGIISNSVEALYDILGITI